jgi:hypothetical protein
LETNGHYSTSDLTCAAFFYASGVIFIGIDRPNGQTGKAFFLFQRPHDEIISAWQRGEDKVSARTMHEAIRFLNQELREGR